MLVAFVALLPPPLLEVLLVVAEVVEVLVVLTLPVVLVALERLLVLAVPSPVAGPTPLVTVLPMLPSAVLLSSGSSLPEQLVITNNTPATK